MKTPQQVRQLLGTWPSATLPIALLPMRIETRFIRRGPDAVEFRLRIFPDDVHIDAFERELTAPELETGKTFWQRAWRAKDDAEQSRVVWQTLVERFGAPRAAWIARATTPTNLDRLGSGKPTFPEVALHDDPWNRAPLARLLPDRFVAVGYLEGERVLLQVGNPVPRTLAVGPSPEAPPPPGIEPYADQQDELVVDDGMRWLTDFDVAERDGMALRVMLDEHAADHGFDELVVIGLDATNDPAATGAALESILDSAHYTDGLSFVPHGTPTNNTDDTRVSDLHQDSFDAERGAPLVSSGDGSDADLLARALGIRTQVFAHVAHAATRESEDAAHMQRAMWYGGWGTYFREIVNTQLGLDNFYAARDHFAAFVRARGPLPTLRIANQPYGVLPVLAMSHWTAPEGNAFEAGAITVLEKLRDIWRSKLDKVPRIGRTGPLVDGREDLLQAIAQQSASSELIARPISNPGIFGIFSTPNFEPEFPDGGVAQRRDIYRRREAELGLSRFSRLSNLLVMSDEFPIAATLSQHALDASRLEPNYIDWLRTASYFEIDTEDFSKLGEFGADNLLYLVLRHATLLEYAYAAGFILVSEGKMDPALVSEPGMFDADPFQAARPTLGMLLNETSDKFDGRALGEVIHGVSGADHAEGVALDRFRASLAHLATLAPASLDQLLRDCFDLSSYRLDAWATSFATARLAEVRAQLPAGILAGAYGWLENVRRNASREATEPPAGEAGTPLMVNGENAGYVLTPSMNHATTAAVLRSGYLSQPDAGNPLAVDLTSRRVRLAQSLIDGVRQGQPLSALLGYRFERELQQRRMAHYIEPFRRLAPFGEIRAALNTLQEFEAEVERLRGTSLFDLLRQAQANAAAARERYEALLQRHRDRFLFPPATQLQAMEEAAEFNVVDGIALRRLFQADAIPFGQNALPLPGGSDHKAVVAALRELDDAVDAVGDAVTAESVYHTVRGNPMKVGATLNALATGETPPPELEVTRTPRMGVGAQHRLMVLFGSPHTSVAGWPASKIRVRSAAERHVNAWAIRILGNPRRVRIVAEYVDPLSDDVLATQEMRLDELEISALDCLYATRGHREPSASMITRWALHHLQSQQPAELPDDVVIRLNPDRQIGWSASDTSLAEFVEVARASYDLIAQARPLDPEDLVMPGSNAAVSINAANVEVRANKAVEALNGEIEALAALITDAENLDAQGARAGMLALSWFGIDTAVPDPPRPDPLKDRENLISQAQTVLREALDRRARHDALVAGFTPRGATARARRDHAVARLKAVFGEDFAVLTRMTLADPNPLMNGFAHSTAIQDGDPMAVYTWLHRMARVRDGVQRLETVLEYAQARTNSTTHRYFPQLAVCQLPAPDHNAAQGAQRWIGLPLRDGEEPPGGQLSIAAHLPRQLPSDKPLLGLVIDGWMEAFPNAHQHAAIAFNFDAPGARPPQAILLAVPPFGSEQDWDFEALEASVRDAMELARLRAIDPLTLNEIPVWNHFLPALLYSLNLEGDTISTDFVRAAQFRPPPTDPPGPTGPIAPVAPAPGTGPVAPIDGD